MPRPSNSNAAVADEKVNDFHDHSYGGVDSRDSKSSIGSCSTEPTATGGLPRSKSLHESEETIPLAGNEEQPQSWPNTFPKSQSYQHPRSSTRNKVTFDDDNPDSVFFSKWMNLSSDTTSGQKDANNTASSPPSMPRHSTIHWLPHKYEHDPFPRHRTPLIPRSLKRRLFLFLSEPSSSLGSALFFFLLMFAIILMNIVMILQTCARWQYTPDDCITCGGHVVYTFEDDSMDDFIEPPDHVPCVCPPTPYAWLDATLKWLINFFTVEWISRVALFEPPHQPHRRPQFWRLWWNHLSSSSTILDALAIFPFYLESLEGTNGLMSLRLLRLFRVFSLLRLGQYNTTFLSLTHVLSQSLIYLRLLVIILVFGAALFGSLMYWLEKGSWQYHPASASYRFLRVGVDGVTEEPTPFTSIPAAFWWFLVTATTVGYGDYYPTSVAGKWVACCAMLMGVLVVAFPVSVFSDLWSKEVRNLNLIQKEDDDDDNGVDTNNSPERRKQEVLPSPSADNKKRGEMSNNAEDNTNNPSSTFYYESSKAKDWDTLMSAMTKRQRTPPHNHNKRESNGTGSHRSTKSLDCNMLLPSRSCENEKNFRQDDQDVTMKKEDLKEILDRLDQIQDHETRIRDLLKKYE